MFHVCNIPLFYIMQTYVEDKTVVSPVHWQSMWRTSSTFNPYYLLTCGVHTLPSTPLSTSCSIYISCMWCLSFTFKPFYLLCVIHISYMLCISYAFNPLYLLGALLCLRMLYISFVFIPFICLPHYLGMWCISFAFTPLFNLAHYLCSMHVVYKFCDHLSTPYLSGALFMPSMLAFYGALFMLQACGIMRIVKAHFCSVPFSLSCLPPKCSHKITTAKAIIHQIGLQ